MTPDPPPSYASLPAAPDGGRSAWQVFDDVDVGAMSLQHPARVVAAARLVQSGRTFPLDAPLSMVEPPMFGRTPPRHTVFTRAADSIVDDVLDNVFPQVSSQWDALCHAAYSPGTFFGGCSIDDVCAGRLTIDHLARRGVAGRAVVLDAEAVLSQRDPGYHPQSSLAITPADLEACRAAAGVAYEPGDVLVLNTGFLRWYLQATVRERTAGAAGERLVTTGLERTEAMVEYLWDSHPAAVVSDLPGLEQWPADLSPGSGPFGFLHRMLLGQLGIFIGELWYLQDLVDDCRADGRYTALLVSAPLHVPGGAGSTANAIAVK